MIQRTKGGNARKPGMKRKKPRPTKFFLKKFVSQ